MDLLYTAHVPAGEGPFPTILLLHGWGASAHDLIGLAPILHGGGALALAPQGPVEVPIGPGVSGYGWFPLTAGEPPDPREFELGAQAIRKFLDEAIEKYPIDRRKLIVLGFSQGGVMAFDLVLREPERFGGLVGLSTWLPEEIRRSLAPTPGLESLPTLVLHGTEDPMIDIERARETRESLLGLGVNLTYQEYEMGHEIRPEALRELLRWLDEKAISPIQLV